MHYIVKPITLTLHPSRILLMLFLAMGLFFSLMLFLAPLPHWLRIAILSLIAANTFYFSLRDALLALPWSCVALNINIKNQLQLICKDGRQLDVVVLESTVVTPYLTVLNYHRNEASFMQRLFIQHLIIFHDAVDVEGFRQLRVYLRWAKPQTASSD